MRHAACMSRAVFGLVALALGSAPAAWSFCGFYVAKADAELWNEASEVVIARDGERTVLTMSNDYKGAVRHLRHERQPLHPAHQRARPALR